MSFEQFLSKAKLMQKLNLCFSQFGPVWFQVINNAIQCSRQSDPMGKKNNQNQVREESCEVHNLQRDKNKTC